MLDESELADLREAKRMLESPGLAVRIADGLGKPVEWVLKSLPSRANQMILSATRTALDKALGVALRTLDARARKKPSNALHRGIVMATGAAGGALGLASLSVELPITTTVILRSIADQARAQGEDLTAPEARLNCLLVLALGGKSQADDAADTGYFAVRVALGRAVAQAAEYISERGVTAAVAEKSAPVLARLLAAIAERFSLNVTPKIAAQMFPIIGAVGGLTVNSLFIGHYQRAAWGHFTIRRLERVHGAEVVREAYAKIGG